MNGTLFLLGSANAVAIICLGLVAAGLQMWGVEADWFWRRLVPSMGYIIGTSIAAGAVLWVTNTLFGG